jgi:hypothetical protein
MMVYKNFVNFLNYIGFSFVIFYVSQPKCMVVEYEAGITFRLALARGNVYDVRCPAEQGWQVQQSDRDYYLTPINDQITCMAC